MSRVYILRPTRVKKKFLTYLLFCFATYISYYNHFPCNIQHLFKHFSPNGSVRAYLLAFSEYLSYNNPYFTISILCARGPMDMT